MDQLLDTLNIDAIIQARKRLSEESGESSAVLLNLSRLNEALSRNLKQVIQNLKKITKEKSAVTIAHNTCKGKLTEHKSRMASFKANNQTLTRDLRSAETSLISANSELARLEIKSDGRRIKFNKLTKELAKVSAYKDQLDRKLHLINKNLGRIDNGISKQIGKIADDNVLNDIRDVTTYMENMAGGSSSTKREKIIMKKLKIKNEDILEVIGLFFKKKLKKKSDLIILAKNINVSVTDSKGKLLKVKQIHRKISKGLSGITGINKKYILSL